MINKQHWETKMNKSLTRKAFNFRQFLSIPRMCSDFQVTIAIGVIFNGFWIWLEHLSKFSWLNFSDEVKNELSHMVSDRKTRWVLISSLCCIVSKRMLWKL